VKAVLLAVVASTLLGGSLPAVAGSDPDTSTTPPPRAVLTKPYAPVLGEMMAFTLSDFFATAKIVDSPILASYDKATKKIEIIMFGARASADGAKESVGDFLAKGLPLIEAVVSSVYGPRLDEDQLRVIYYNRLKENEEVLRWEGGQYIIR